MPALRSASSNAFRSETRETALPEVTKNFFGIWSMASLRVRDSCHLRLSNQRCDGLRHRVGIVAPRVVRGQAFEQLVSELPVERDRARVAPPGTTNFFWLCKFHQQMFNVSYD